MGGFYEGKGITHGLDESSIHDRNSPLDRCDLHLQNGGYEFVALSAFTGSIATESATAARSAETTTTTAPSTTATESPTKAAIPAVAIASSESIPIHA
jgi:hypothetical protein